ncbi:MAG: hypothetical protein SNJ82_11620 [Gemmataceae bacterium]
MLRPRIACLFAFALFSVAWTPSYAADEKIKIYPLAVNSPADEDEPHLADGGLTLLFTGQPKEGKDELMIATRRMVGAPWGKAQVLQDYIRTKGNDRGAFVMSGAYPRYLFYATTKDQTQNNFDLYVAVQQDKGRAWSAPTPVMNVNTNQDELHPWLSADGKTLYFSRKTADGWKQMQTTRNTSKGPGGWSEPTEAGLPVGFRHLTLMPDGKTGYVQGPQENGREGIYVVTRQDKGWSKPLLLNQLEDGTGKRGNLSPNLSRDGKYLYFASDRDGGKGGLDLYYVTTASIAIKK